MFPGFNTNVPYKGRTFHVQTEDSGPRNPVIVTLLYSLGAIVASRKTSYSHLMEDPDWRLKVPEIMRSQHREFIRDLLSGKLTGEEGPSQGGGGGIDDLDRRFLGYITGEGRDRH
ncbi:MAG: hypothetical protein Kow0025_10880 [Thermodesulfovibrionales bacterium]